MFAQCSPMPYEPVILGPRYAIRLEDLEAADAIDAECMGCGKRWRIAPHRLHDRYQAYVRLQQIATEMRCAVCDGDSSISWKIVRAAPDGPGSRPAPRQRHGD